MMKIIVQFGGKFNDNFTDFVQHRIVIGSCFSGIKNFPLIQISFATY